MVINKKLIWDICEYIVSVHALTPDIIMNRYKITRSKIDSIIDIMSKAGIIEFVSYTEPYKVIPKDKDELKRIIQTNGQIIDEEIENKSGNQKKKQILRERKSLTDILEYLKLIERKLDRIESKIDRK